jgi:ssDNA-binding Zn-finger/Zn-ribbon topoisomerase 1
MATTNSVRRTVYSKRREDGFCPRCGKKKRKTEKFIYCTECREYFRNYNSEFSDSQNEKRNTRYSLRKENGQCPRCGKTLGKRYTKTLCKTCLDKQYLYNTGRPRE